MPFFKEIVLGHGDNGLSGVEERAELGGTINSGSDWRVGEVEQFN